MQACILKNTLWACSATSEHARVHIQKLKNSSSDQKGKGAKRAAFRACRYKGNKGICRKSCGRPFWSTGLQGITFKELRCRLVTKMVREQIGQNFVLAYTYSVDFGFPFFAGDGNFDGDLGGDLELSFAIGWGLVWELGWGLG